MRIGVLIIGSLYWERSAIRCRWRLNRLGCDSDAERKVRVPIRYGKKSTSRNDTYTMVFSQECSDATKLGIGLVVPARAECCEPEHLLEEAKQLWIAEVAPKAPTSPLCASWGKVCILKNPRSTIDSVFADAWQAEIRAAGKRYTAIPHATNESGILDYHAGQALFEWPIDDKTSAPLAGCDLLLMTANHAWDDRVVDRRYPTAEEIAKAWLGDAKENVNYFHNNRHYGIVRFRTTRFSMRYMDGNRRKRRIGSSDNPEAKTLSEPSST